MSDDKLIVAAFKSTPYIIRLSLSVSWIYFTLGWQVGRARKAFEKQMISQGMSKENARQLSAFYNDLKDSITSTVKQSIASSDRSR